MKIHLELNCETLNEVRAELASFLASDTAAAAPMVTDVTAPVAAEAPMITETAVATESPTRKSKGRPGSVGTAATQPSAVDVALRIPSVDTATRPARTSAPARQTRSAADVALGLEADDDVGEEAENEDGRVSRDSRQPDAEQLLADKAQLNFDFDRVLALQGRAAALGIVRGVLPPGTKTKIKDIEALPVELIGAAIAALQAAGAD
jgi:hypothetical protein